MSKYLKNIEKTRNTDGILNFYSKLEDFLKTIEWDEVQKVSNFPVLTFRQRISWFLERYELFKMIRKVPGFIIECGVADGYVKHEEHYEDEDNRKHLRAVVPKKFLEKYNEDVFAETKSGDLLVGHFNTFHISGINSSKKVRYTMLVRASNIMGPNFLV